MVSPTHTAAAAALWHSRSHIFPHLTGNIMRSLQACLLSAVFVRGGDAFIPPGTGPHVPVRTPGCASWDVNECSTARSSARPVLAGQKRTSATLRMMATNNPPPSGTENNLGSYYRRPSAAIERGGGFFVPGLEGFRLRFVLAAVILGLLSLDGFSRPGMTTSQVVSEALAGLAGVVLFGQALLDQQKERAVEMRREAVAAAPASAGGGDVGAATEEGKVAFFDSAALGGDLEAKVRWAADIVLQLTAACSFVVFSDGKVLARVGDTGGESDDASVVAAAFEQAASSSRAATTATPEGAAAAAAGKQDGGGGGGGGGGPPSATIIKKRNRGANDDGDDDDRNDQALMLLLPSSCRQGVLCRIPSPPSGGAVGGRDLVVLLGSTLAGAGVFSGMDGAWFERVCACLALGPTGAAATVAVEAGGR